MSSVITLVVFVAVVAGLMLFSARARRRQAAVQAERAEAIEVGTEVMTTSGLYGTVIARNDDDSVQLQIAHGVVVRWALAALREVSALPEQFRGPADGEAAVEAVERAGSPDRPDRPVVER